MRNFRSDKCLYSTLPVIHKVRELEIEKVFNFISKFNSNAEEWKRNCLFSNPVHVEWNEQNNKRKEIMANNYRNSINVITNYLKQCEQLNEAHHHKSV